MKELDGDANHTMFGFSTDPNLNAHYNSIDFSWYVDNGGMHVYEFGNQVGSATYDEESVYTIARVGSTVSYYQDGVLQRSVSGITTADLYLDSSFHSSIELRDIKVGVTYVEDAGKVLQVVTNTMAGTSNSTSSTGWTFTGLFVDITPQSTNSKIIVLYDHGIGFNNSTGNARIEYQLFSASDSDVLVMKKYTGAEINGVPSFTQRMAISGSGSYINSSTAPKTFKLQVRPADGNSAECSTIYYNWYSGAEHSMIAMEVSA
jgi:hypothetical protein